MLAEIKKLSLSGKPVRYILNTSADADHIGGNESLAKVARLRVQLDDHQHAWRHRRPRCKIIAHDNVLSRMSTLPTQRWPTETFVGREKEIYFNGEPVFMYHVPDAHTDGDSIVFFRRSDVIATGDIYRTDSYPGDRSAEGRQRAGRDRRLEPRARSRRARSITRKAARSSSRATAASATSSTCSSTATW